MTSVIFIREFFNKCSVRSVMLITVLTTLTSFAYSVGAEKSATVKSVGNPAAMSFDVSGLPDGLSLLALIDGKWSVIVASDGKLTSIPGINYPRGVSYHHKNQIVAWIGADDKLRILDLVSGKTDLLNSERQSARFTQPTFHPDGDSLIVVELPDGKSRSTRIVEYVSKSEEWRFLVRKRTAQFEPYLSATNLLHYTTAICVDDCIGMIWELWQKNLNSGEQLQLTLLNAVSKSPRLGGDEWLYFSSNKDKAGYHLWRMRPEPGAPPVQLTSGNVKDSDPSPAADGSVYFIRNSKSGSALMRWQEGKELETIVLPEQFTALRTLELNP